MKALFFSDTDNRRSTFSVFLLVTLCSVVEPETWAEAANRIVQKSQTERTKSCQLRSDSEALINHVAQEMWDSWSHTNNALSRRSSELLEAKSLLKQHLHKVIESILVNTKALASHLSEFTVAAGDIRR